MQPYVVTGCLPLPTNTYRSTARYAELGAELLKVGLPTLAFLDKSVPVNPDLLEPHNPTQRIDASIEQCWMTPYLKDAVNPPGNPEKDVKEYHAIQFQKAEWVLEAFRRYDSPFFLWIDFGVMHIGAKPQQIREFYRRACACDYAGKLNKICIASIWDLPANIHIDYDTPNWFCAGGAFVIPRYLVEWFAGAVKRAMLGHIKVAGRLTWEVNVWASLAQAHPELFSLWKGGHNETMFTGAFAQY